MNVLLFPAAYSLAPVLAGRLAVREFAQAQRRVGAGLVGLVGLVGVRGPAAQALAAARVRNAGLGWRSVVLGYLEQLGEGRDRHGYA